MTVPLPPLLGEPKPREPLVPAWAWLWRNRHVTVPVLAVPPAFVMAGAVLAHAPSAAWPTAIGSAVLAATMSVMARHKWDRLSEQVYAIASAAAAGGWLTAAAFAGLGVPELAAGAVLALAWGVPWWWHKRPRRHAAEQWDAWWQHYAAGWGLRGSRVLDITTAGVIDTLRVQLWAGRQHLKDVTTALPLIESALQGHVEAGMTRCEAVRRNPSQVLIHLKRENPHDTEVQWDPSLAPKSVTELAPLGKNEAGEWVYGPLLDNWFLIGRKRSGKSNELSALFTSWTGCRDAQPPWLIDLKGGRSARPWREAIDWLATGIDEARLMLATAAAEVRARAEHCYTGVEQNVPTLDVPALLVAVDEAHGVLSQMSGDSECNRYARVIAAEGAAVNVHLWVMTQHGALDTSVGNEQIRANMPCRMCFAVSDPAHGQFALPDWAHLDASKLENQGEFYYRLGHDMPASTCRGPHMPHPSILQFAAGRPASARARLLLYAEDWQETYDTRRDRLPASFGGPARARRPVEAPMSPTPPQPAEDSPERMAQRIADEVAALPNVATPPQVPAELLADATTRRKDRFAQLLTQAPPEGITPKALKDGTGLGNTWVHQQLAALLGIGVVTKVSDGHYRAVPGQNVWAGLQQVWNANARLADLAREKISA